MNANKQVPERVELAPISKAVYAAPILRIYGAVAALTCTGTGNKADSANSSAMNNGGSDPSIKENIVRVGTHPIGFGLYLFDYKPDYRQVWGNGRQFGVMADEVESVFPQAILFHPEGYRLVNYEILGISRFVH